MSGSVSPCHLSGSGRIDLASRSSRSTFTDSSPLRVVITVPCTPTQSPRSSSFTSAKASSPITAFDTKSWTSTPRSAIVANTSLPVSRSSITRPAIATSSSVSVSGLEPAPPLAHLGDGVGAVEPVRVRVGAEGAHLVELRQSPAALGLESREVAAILVGWRSSAVTAGTLTTEVVTYDDVSIRFVIIGGGPAGNTAATHAARLGADVVMIERDVVGGGAHLWDCIPSKTMIATGGAMSFSRRLEGMGLEKATTAVDVDALTARIEGIERHMNRGITELLVSQGVTLVRGAAHFTGPNEVEVATTDGSVRFPFDNALIATGSRPRIPDWCQPDGDRILTTRDCYPPKVFPESVTVIGSGVTGVEFVHMFSSFGAEVTLVVSRQQVLPGKDPEVAAVLEDDFLRRGVQLLKGARATAIERDPDSDGVVVQCNDGRVVRSSHAVLAIGSIPNSDDLDLAAAGVEVDQGYVPIDHNCVTSVPHIYAAGDVSGKLPLSSVAADAGAQGRRATDGPAHPRAPPSRLRQGGVGDLHRARDRRCRTRRGRGVRLGTQDPCHQGAVLGGRQGADQR